MHRIVILSLVMFLQQIGRSAPIAIEKYFPGEDACFELFDLSTGKTTYRLNEKRCAERVPACSTFKVALALMAFDKGILQDERTPFKWDGKDYGMPVWNQDQTAASWMKNSVVWVSQRITPQLGSRAIEEYLRKFGFGTADMSGGIETAWLTVGSPSNKVTKTTLLISADEQLRFLGRLWKGELPVSKRAVELTKKLIYQEKSSNGYELSGKTGSGFVGPDRSQRLGWFVAHLEKAGEQYVSVVSFTSPKQPDGNRYAGFEAREKLTRILTDLGKF